MPRKTPGKMRLYLVKEGYDSPDGHRNDEIIAQSDEGVTGDAAAREMVEAQGPGSYVVITGRAKTAVLMNHTVTSFTLT